MTKTELIKQASARSLYFKGGEELSLTQRQMEVALNALVNTIKTALVNGEKVQIAGFGSFEVNVRPAREGRNPSTGEVMTIAASKNVKFKAAKDMKDALK